MAEIAPGQAAEEVSTMAEVVHGWGSRGGLGDGQSHSRVSLPGTF
jgi:hypothetical protein